MNKQFVELTDVIAQYWVRIEYTVDNVPQIIVCTNVLIDIPLEKRQHKPALHNNKNLIAVFDLDSFEWQKIQFSDIKSWQIVPSVRTFINPSADKN